MAQTMVAKKDMRYNGARLRAGDRFEAVSDKAVRVFTLSRRAEVVASDDDAELAGAMPRRRRYNRRDLLAQD